MANTVPFYRLYLTEKLRKFLGINLKNKKIYVFKVNHITYLSTTTIPKSGKVKVLNVTLGETQWFINIPTTYLEYEPAQYTLLNTVGKVLELIPSEKIKN